MRLMDRAWGQISPPDVINSWIKRQCLPQKHVEEVKRIAYKHGDMRHASGEPDLPVDAEKLINWLVDMKC